MGPISPSMLEDLHWPLLSQWRKCARSLLYKSLKNLLSIPSTFLQVPTPLLSTRSNHIYTATHQLIVTNSPFSQEQYQSGMISLQELYSVNHLISLISICMNILLYNSAHQPLCPWWTLVINNNNTINHCALRMLQCLCVVYSTMYLLYIVVLYQ